MASAGVRFSVVQSVARSVREREHRLHAFAVDASMIRARAGAAAGDDAYRWRRAAVGGLACTGAGDIIRKCCRKGARLSLVFIYSMKRNLDYRQLSHRFQDDPAELIQTYRSHVIPMV